MVDYPSRSLRCIRSSGTQKSISLCLVREGLCFYGSFLPRSVSRLMSFFVVRQCELDVANVVYDQNLLAWCFVLALCGSYVLLVKGLRGTEDTGHHGARCVSVSIAEVTGSHG